MTAISKGSVEHAKRVAKKNTAIFADAVRQGFHVVASEPSAALALIREYPQLIDDDNVTLVAENTSEVCSYLWQMHSDGQLELDLKPLSFALGYHQPCHQRALNTGQPGENLLRLIPGLTVHQLENSCSGMAGVWGMSAKNYRSSLRAGWPLISALRRQTIQVGTTECSACKIQMEQGTSKPTVHPIKVLAIAYNLMPELGALLNAQSEELIVT